MIDGPKDVIGRVINIGDYVFTNNLLYEVLDRMIKKRPTTASPKTYTGEIKIILINKSKRTRAKYVMARDCCLVLKEDYLIHCLRDK